MAQGSYSASHEFDLVGPLKALDADSRETVPRRVPAHPTPCLNRRAPNMRHQNDPFLPYEGMIRPDVGFTGRDVQPGRSESTSLNRLDERLGINHGSTRRVDDTSGRFHFRQELGGDEVARFGRERTAEEDQVALARELVVRRGGTNLDPEVGSEREGVKVVARGGELLAELRSRVQDALDAESEQALDRRLPNFAESDHTHRGLCGERLA